jgi:Zn-dependent protease with chaperone function
MSVERVSFYDEQARWRRQTWRGSFVCGLASSVMGAPLAVLLTPIAFLAVGLTLRYTPGPGGDDALAALVSAARFIPQALETALETEELSSLLSPPAILAFSMLLAPGMAVLLVVWFFLRLRFARSGVGGLLLSLSARPPRAQDVEEAQLANVIEEMAIAAGMRLPALRILDDDAPNAAAVGSGEDDATVVASRAVLARLDREQTQAIAAHLLGSIASGDLRILASLNAVFECAGLVILVLDAAFGLSPSAFRDLARVLRFLLGGGRDPEEASLVQKLLIAMTGEVREDGIHQVSEGPTVKKYPFLNFFLLPFLLLNVVNLMLKWQTWLIRSIFVGPMVMVVWRRRRFHADAVAVQLTRNPDALAKALSALSVDAALLSRAGWAEPLFVVGAPGGGWSKELGGLGASHPPLAKRLKRIAAMGGRDPSGPEPSWKPRQWTAASLVLVPLAALTVPLMGVVVVLSFVLAAFPALLVTLAGLAIVVAILT